MGLASMDLVAIQVLALLAIFAVAIVGGAIPLVSSKWTENERFFSLGNAFAGGLFLGLGFIHLLPEGIELLAPYSTFPWGAIAATTGFGLLLLLDRILFPDESIPNWLGESASEAFYPYVLLGMLGVHSLVAGVALGLETSVAGVVAMFIGIAAHKGAAAFALMVCAYSSGINRSRLKVFLAVFSVMTPIGIVLGISSGVLFRESGDVYAILQGSFSAFAGGTFIYIAVIDIISREFRTHHVDLSNKAPNLSPRDEAHAPAVRDRMLKFLLLAIGIALVAFVTAWAHPVHAGEVDCATKEPVESVDSIKCAPLELSAVESK